MELGETKRNCSFCSEINAKYSCPKCGRFYCSSKCYNCEDHLNCKEIFYRKLVEDELKLQSKESNEDYELKKRTLDILKREYEIFLEEDEQDFNFEEMKLKFDKLHLLDENDLWKNLSDEDKENFKKLLKKNEVINLLPVDSWTPWYLKLTSKPLIEEIDSNDKLIEEKVEKKNENLVDQFEQNSHDQLNKKKSVQFRDKEENDKSLESKRNEFIKEIEDNLNEFNSRVPKLKLPIKKLIELTKVKPSPYVKCTLMNILFSYCFMCRHFNNDHLYFVNESFELIDEISLLNQKSVFITAREAVQFTIQLLINKKKIKIDLVLILIDDLKFIMKNENKICLNIISDLINLVKKYKLNLKKRLKSLKDEELKDTKNLEDFNDKSKDVEEKNIKSREIPNEILNNDKVKEIRLKDVKDKELKDLNKLNKELKDLSGLLKKLEYYLSFLNENQNCLIEQTYEIDLERVCLLDIKKSIDKGNKKEEIRIY